MLFLLVSEKYNWSSLLSKVVDQFLLKTNFSTWISHDFARFVCMSGYSGITFSENNFCLTKSLSVPSRQGRSAFFSFFRSGCLIIKIPRWYFKSFFIFIFSGSCLKYQMQSFFFWNWRLLVPQKVLYFL